MATIVAAQAAVGAEFTAEPLLAVGEEYNDNIYLAAENKTQDYITHVLPGVNARYASPILVSQLSYSYDRRYYANTPSLNEGIQNVFFLSTVQIVKDLLFFDVQDTAGKESLSSVRDYTVQSPVQYQTKYNDFQMGPYAVLQLTSQTTLTTGYAYRKIWYSDPTAIDQTDNSFYGDLSRMLSEKTALTANFRQERIETFLGTRTRMNALFGASHNYQDGSLLWGRIGPSKTTYENNQSNIHVIWDAGFIHTLSSTMTVSYLTSRSWIVDPSLVERREDQIIVALRSQGDRTSTGVSFAARNYGTDFQYSDQRRYTITADYNHFLMQQLRAFYAVMADRYQRYPANAPDTMTVVWTTDVRLEYYATTKLTLYLAYQYVNSYSQDIYQDYYKVNSLYALAKMTF